MQTRQKRFDVAVKEVDDRRRRIVFVASQEVLDRDGEVIVAKGIDTAEFARNPIFLGDHDRTFILGKVTRLWIEPRPDGDALLGEADILPPATSPRVDEAYAAIRFGARNGISIGFLPVEVDRKAMLPGQTGPTFRRIKLLEVSSVAIPSCPTCVITAKHCRGSGDVDRFAAAVERAVFELLHPEAAAFATVAETAIRGTLGRR